MNLSEAVPKVVAAVLALAARRRTQLLRDHDPAWRLVCAVDSGFVTPDGLTQKGRDIIDLLARELAITS